ncbi:1-acyl-sn-glycerol-3-phosphate acyltransferase [Ureaplasma miroungigenitalium]|uniref:lysophospholipid acyltransferase family protein n=1 Tax=Ureaplasma miroungigenitalium TaxID=1042321 RepID=UPI0021E98F31|nr:lysophospholipid acyltransferase family protein [Ureaplasma miroungigenitalium]MCV3734006.1 1-acyl-sn-glycerol-3-phosphate acyltransferase [Ureaplasma miroungigenitalium]
MNFLKAVWWIMSSPFVFFYVIWQMLFAKLLANKYKKNPEEVSEADRYKKVSKILHAIMWILNVKVKVENERFLTNRNMFYVGNHKSNIDALALFLALEKHSLQNVTFVAKIELQKSFFAPLFDLIDVVYVDRKNLRQILGTMKQQENLLKARSRGLAVFPETKRNHSDEFFAFQPAALTPAYNTASAIQPFVIGNSINTIDRYDNNNKRMRRNFAKAKNLYVSFLKPFNSYDYVNIDKQIIMRNIEKKIVDEYTRLKNVHNF